jgi:hypothetical protein
MSGVWCLPFAAHFLPPFLYQLFHNLTRHCPLGSAAAVAQSPWWQRLSALCARLDMNSGRFHLEYVLFGM